MSTSCLKVVTLHQLHAINTYRTFEYPAKTDWTSTRRRLTHQWCHEEEILITCTHAHNFAKRHWGGRRGGGGGLDVLKTCGKSSCSLRKRSLKQPQVTKYMKVIISHLQNIAIATPLMKRVHEKHSSTFIRHAGEFLHMDHYELTYVFILLINLLVIELILW